MTHILLKDPDLVANDADGMSCLHACIQMVMKSKEGGRVFSFDEINTILRRKPGTYSWRYAIVEAVGREGFQVKNISTFSTKRFVEEKEAYLLERFGEEAGRVQIKNTDMPTVLEDAQKYLESNRVETIVRMPTLEDIRTLLADGWYLIPALNAKVLDSKPGYGAHSIFIFGCDDEGIVFHDPGLPAQSSRRASWKLFEEAWSSPSAETRGITCYKAVE